MHAPQVGSTDPTAASAPPAPWRGRVEDLQQDILALARELEEARRQALAAAQAVPEDIWQGDTRLDMRTRRLWIRDKSFWLTPSEFKFLSVIMAVPGRVFARMELLLDTCGVRIPSQSRLIDAHAHRLRKKLGPAGWHIEAVRGVGYRWKKEEDPCQ